MAMHLTESLYHLFLSLHHRNFQLVNITYFPISNSGTHEYYEVYAASSNDIILCNKTEENVFEIEFPVVSITSVYLSRGLPAMLVLNSYFDCFNAM